MYVLEFYPLAPLARPTQFGPPSEEYDTKHISGAPIQRSTPQKTNNNDVVISREVRFSALRLGKQTTTASSHPRLAELQQQYHARVTHPLGASKSFREAPPPKKMTRRQGWRHFNASVRTPSHLPRRERCVFVPTQCKARHRHSVARLRPIRLEPSANLRRKYIHKTTRRRNPRKKHKKNLMKANKKMEQQATGYRLHRVRREKREKTTAKITKTVERAKLLGSTRP